MRAGDGDVPLVPAADSAQQHRTLDGGNARFHRRHKLGIVLRNGSRIDHQLRVPDVLGALSDGDRDPEGAQTFDGVGIVVHVGAGDGLAIAPENVHQRAHAGAAYADEMYAVDPVQQLVVFSDNLASHVYQILYVNIFV